MKTKYYLMFPFAEDYYRAEAYTDKKKAREEWEYYIKNNMPAIMVKGKEVEINEMLTNIEKKNIAKVKREQEEKQKKQIDELLVLNKIKERKIFIECLLRYYKKPNARDFMKITRTMFERSNDTTGIKAFKLYYLNSESLTLEKVGKQLNLSRERIRQKIEKMFGEIYKAIHEEWRHSKNSNLSNLQDDISLKIGGKICADCKRLKKDMQRKEKLCST